MADSWCQKCPKPGNCCKKLKLSGENQNGDRTLLVFWGDEGIEAANKNMEERGLPFRAFEVDQVYTDEQSGRSYVSYHYSCPKLGEDGRCTIYEKRPDLCRRYSPGQDALCVFTKKGKLRAAHKGENDGV